MISTEQVFDVLPLAVSVYEKLNFDEFRKGIVTDGKSKNEIGLEVFMFILKNAGKVKADIFDIVAILDKKATDEIKAQPFTKTMASIKELLNEPDIADFFKQAVQ